MRSSGMRRMALVRTDVSEELSVSFIRVTRIGELGTTLAVTSNRRTVQLSSEMSVLTRPTWRNMPEDTILQVLCVPIFQEFLPSTEGTANTVVVYILIYGVLTIVCKLRINGFVDFRH
jgi:hypothetical protein